MDKTAAWTPSLPTTPGYYELWDPRRDIDRIVHLFRTRDDRLAVRNFCRCKYAFLLRMWELPCFRRTHWRGPLHVPHHLPPDRTGCLLPHCDQQAE